MFSKKFMRKHWNNLKKVKKVIDFSKISRKQNMKKRKRKFLSKNLKKENRNLIIKIKSIQSKRQLSKRISFRNLKKQKNRSQNKSSFKINFLKKSLIKENKVI